MSLNFDNFEGELSKETPYILTSPTSLRVCSQLRIQPDELIYHSLEEYEETLSDLPLSDIYRIYEENETERQVKLLQCRELRRELKFQRQRTAMAISPEIYNNGSTTTSPLSSNSPASTKSKNTNKNNTKNANSQEKMRRYASAPAVNKSNLKSEVNFRINNNLRGSVSSKSARTRSRSGGRVQLCTSDTESTEDLNTSHIHSHSTADLVQNDSYCSKRSVPDLTRSNLDFRKISSPRHLCPCYFEPKENEIVNEYLRRYGDFLDSPDLTPEDRKIMERLILKKGRQMEWERKSQEMRSLIDKDRTKRFTQNQLLMQDWHDKLAEKRRIENIENTKRYLEIQEKSQETRSNLMIYIEKRDRKVQKYLEDINYKKKKSLLEKQKREALRQLEVGKAIDKLVEEDRQNRQIMRDKLQRRMEEADARKRRREKDYFRHVSEMNRMEDIKRCLKLERLEQKSRESVEELRNQIEEKEHRARMNYINRIDSRNRALSEGGGCRQKAMEKAHAIHHDLLKGLEDWHKKVLDLQLEAQKRAEMKYNQEIHRKRVRVASERILREERTTEMLRKVQDYEAQRKDLLKTLIATKESKSARVKADKERRVQVSRIRAQHGAELRQQLKEKIDPDTFDRKAARAEMELRIMKRNPPSGFSVKFNPKLISKRCCSCKGRHSSALKASGSGGPTRISWNS